MADQQDSEEIAHLEEVNAELTESLERCRALLRECRENLAANVNEEVEEGDEKRRQSRG